ncbi:hypothetical protein HQ590_13565, partial [bacterium]|nr:hypothetical protein [bacterium]
LWFMDQAGLWSENQETGWYQDPAILESFAQMQQIATESLNRSRQRICDLAVVYSFHTAFHLADRATELDQVTLPLVTRQLEQFARCGVPFDLHLLTELFEPATPEYQAYAFVDTFFLSDADLARIVSLREAGKLLLFFYAPGFAGEHGLSVDRLAGLLQMEVDQVDSIRLPDGKEQRPGFIVRGQDGPLVRRGNVWFCPAPPLPAANLRRALRTAGLHVWLDTNDVLYVGGGYLAIHAATDGPKRLQSPHATRWTNVRSGKQLAGSAAEVTVPLTRGQTLLLAIEPSGS